ncbi:MAG TPA: hypothetical protein VK843_00150 [Planctomycetota bacterium]|nr:hypothetical protein [Planctomycetota bacterium]
MRITTSQSSRSGQNALIPGFALLASALLGTAAPAQDRATQETWTQEKLEATSHEIQKDVEQLRGVKFKADVPVKLSSKEQFVAYALDFESAMAPPARRKADETVLRMLALIPPDMDMLQEELRLLKDQVGGFYDPKSKMFFLMENCPMAMAKTVLAHELGHALDDQLYDIGGSMEKLAERTDAGLAYHAVVEGSGTVVQARWMADHLKPMEMLGMLGQIEEQSAAMAHSPTILWKPLLGSYTTGAAFLGRNENLQVGLKNPPASSDLDRAFRAPPKSTEQVLHPEKYWSDPRDEPIAVEQVCSALPGDWAVLRRDTFGELGIAIWCVAPAQREFDGPGEVANVAGVTFTSPPATGWGGDELVLLGEGEKARAIRWLTVWDSERDAAEFYGAASTVVPALKPGLTRLAGGKSRLTSAAVRYGTSREVVIELGYGAKADDLKGVFETIASK